MGRAGRRDDPSYWLANRRRFHDDLDKLCRSVNERHDMVDAHWLAAKLRGMKHYHDDSSTITVADVQHDGTILLHLTRPAGIQGYTEVRIKVVDDAK